MSALISRRASLLLGAGAAGAATAISIPAGARMFEQPWDRARRLANELAETLDVVDGGAWRAFVGPTTTEIDPVLFEDTRVGKIVPSAAEVFHRAFGELALAMDELAKPGEGWGLSAGSADGGGERWHRQFARFHVDEPLLPGGRSVNVIVGGRATRRTHLRVERHREIII